MKINKQQITALARKISEDLNQEIKTKNALIEESALKLFYKTKEGKAVLMLQKYFKDAYNFQDNSMLNLLKVKKKNTITTYNIESDIILETIECDNLEQIIEKIKNKYNK